MDPARSASSLAPPVLDGSNYAFWKVKMMFYLKAINERVWATLCDGWTAPVAVGDDGKPVPKSSSQWTQEEKLAVSWNSKGMNATHNTVNADEFMRIATCKSTKEAWDILELTHEGTKTIKKSKL